MENAIAEAAKDDNVQSPVDELITGLKDKLKRPKEIVALTVILIKTIMKSYR
ncbi:hypothetical protein SDC49_13860 [Lactobacillus sp. R2/2]|nr:hypothetical protein [Lactobacillus sp. R2/2]